MGQKHSKHSVDRRRGDSEDPYPCVMTEQVAPLSRLELPGDRENDEDDDMFRTSKSFADRRGGRGAEQRAGKRKKGGSANTSKLGAGY